ncbi:MAG: hypothetical protein AAB595_01335 [Patescibacteria group bacterium]
MRKIKATYWVSIVLSLMCIFTITDDFLSFPHNLYGIFMGQFIDIPLGVLSIITSLFIQTKEVEKVNWKTFITTLGIILGLITALLPIVLFKIVMV